MQTARKHFATVAIYGKASARSLSASRQRSRRHVVHFRQHVRPFSRHIGIRSWNAKFGWSVWVHCSSERSFPLGKLHVVPRVRFSRLTLRLRSLWGGRRTAQLEHSCPRNPSSPNSELRTSLALLQHVPSRFLLAQGAGTSLHSVSISSLALTTLLAFMWSFPGRRSMDD